MANYQNEQEVRARIQRQKEQWLREREQQIKAEESLIESQSQYSNQSFSKQLSQRPQQNKTQTSSARPQSGQPQKREGYQPAMVNNLFAKISSKMEDEYAQLPWTSASAQKTKYDQKVEANDKQLHNEVMSNTCPVCYELLMPPAFQPFILFPCGHTFCKKCIEKHAKPKKMCPFCRAPYNSMAPNISLQNLILAANQNTSQQSSVSKMYSNQDQLPQHAIAVDSNDKQAIGTLTNNETNQYLTKYKSLAVKYKVLNDEIRQNNTTLKHLSVDLQNKQSSASQAAKEKSELVAEIEKLKQQLKKVQEVEERDQMAATKLSEKRSEILQQQKILQEQVGPIQLEHDKIRFIIEATAPHLLKTDR